jgi:hypothetical protein
MTVKLIDKIPTLGTGKPLLIGIAGLKYHGKDTTYLSYRKHFEAPYFKQELFAKGIKEAFAAMLRRAGYSSEMIKRLIYGDLKETFPLPEFGGKTSRVVQQLLGTEFGRDLIDPRLWINLTFGKWDKHLTAKPPLRWVITDVRFHNERDDIYARNGIVVRVNNPRVPVANDLHPSEAEVPHLKVSAEITNDSTKKSLGYDFAQIVSLMHGYDARRRGS